MKKIIPAFLYILSLVFLLPGITQPFMTINAVIDKQELFDIAAKEFLSPAQQGNDFMLNMLQPLIQEVHFEGTVTAFESTRSLMDTLCELVAHDHLIVGLLIGLFGVIIPIIKIILTLSSLLLDAGISRNNLLKISSILSKWSMSDVFFMAILVAFFAVNANAQEVRAIQMSAQLRVGFYFFATYCLLAIAASQLMQLWDEPTE